MSVKDRNRAPGQRLTGELRRWVGPVLLALPISVGVYVVLGAVSAAWRIALLVPLSIGPLLVIGYLSRSTVWVLVVWLTPLVALDIALLLGANDLTVLGVASLLVLIWTGAIMLYESFGNAVFGALDGVVTRLADTGLSPSSRATYRELRRAWQRTHTKRLALREPGNLTSSIRALRDTGLRVRGVPAPDARWAEVIEASAASFLQYADMLEGGRQLDFDAAERLLDRRKRLIHALLRDESLPYRVLTYVPFRREDSP
jgi:hypothetical protein